MSYKIAIAGTGYVGLSNGILLAQHNEEEFFHSRVIKNFDTFKKISDVIVANRLLENLKDVEGKVYTRNIFGANS